MDIQSIILGLLQSGPMTGYELKRVFDTTMGHISGASYGTIYPTLRKLEQGGLASVRIVPQDGRPNRKVYTITPEGRESFGHALGGELKVPPYRNVFLTRLFFFGRLSPGRREALAREYSDHIEEKLLEARAIEPLARALGDPYQQMCFDFGLRLLEHFRENMSVLMGELAAQDGDPAAPAPPPPDSKINENKTKRRGQ